VGASAAGRRQDGWHFIGAVESSAVCAVRGDSAFVPTLELERGAVPSVWFLYRKLYLAAFAFMLGPPRFGC
jgi:hypothetical protein